MKKIICLIIPLLIFSLLFASCSPTEKDNYKSILNNFGIDFVKSDFKTTQISSDTADYIRSYQTKTTDKEREKLIEHFKSYQDGEFVKIPNAQNNFDILCDDLINNFKNYSAVSNGYFALLDAANSGNLVKNADTKTLAQFDFDSYCALIYDVDTNILYIYAYSLV